MSRSDWTRHSIAAVSLIALIVVSVVFWDWVSSGESGSTTIRNIGLVIGGVIALWLAFWRSKIADRQAAAAQRQADTAQKQFEIAERGLLNERYQRGAEMLGSGVLSVRLGGIYALQRLAKEHPEQYYIQVMQLFCAFVRHPTNDKNIEAEEEEPTHPVFRLRDDVQAIMKAIGSRSEANLNYERTEELWPNLGGADLHEVYIPRANLSRVDLGGAHMFRAYLIDADLSHAYLRATNLLEANLKNADLSGAYMGGQTRLTQAQLDEACADPDNPPKLDDIVDAETGEPLIWRGRPCESAED